MYKQEVAVIIPVYKAHFSAYELIALKQCLLVLKNYPVIIIKPHSLLIPSDIPGIEKVTTITFDEEYFSSIHGYNRLMLSEMFYSRFINYRYILIYQLDAFVFSDQLTYWCGQGYDYIGAPWLGKKRAWPGKIVNRIKTYLYVRYNAKYPDGLPKIGKQLENRVGNGGLSLRRVEIFKEYCAGYQYAINKYLSMQHPWFNEDIFWSIEINRKKHNLKIPGLKRSLRFAFETRPDIALEINSGQLPFGCHAWDKYISFWKPIFKGIGYDL